MTPDDEQALADKIKALLVERNALDFNRGAGVTLEKDNYIGHRQQDIGAELSQLKKEKAKPAN